MPDTADQVRLWEAPRCSTSNAGWGGDSTERSTDTAVGAFHVTNAASKDSVVLITLAPGAVNRTGGRSVSGDRSPSPMVECLRSAVTPNANLETGAYLKNSLTIANSNKADEYDTAIKHRARDHARET